MTEGQRGGSCGLPHAQRGKFPSEPKYDPLGSNSVTSTTFDLWRQSQRPSQFQEEGTETPPFDWRSVKVFLDLFSKDHNYKKAENG